MAKNNNLLFTILINCSNKFCKIFKNCKKYIKTNLVITDVLSIRLLKIIGKTIYFENQTSKFLCQ